MPIAAGEVTSAQQVRLVNGAGRSQMLQARVLERWHDGSIRWLLIDFLADHGGGYGDAV